MAKKRTYGPSRRKVKDRRNSESDVPLSQLNWMQWWIDRGFSGQVLYLKVPHADPTLGSVHRVYCKWSDTPRLEMKDGELYWLIDKVELRVDDV